MSKLLEATVDIKEVTSKIKYFMKRAKTEEDVKIAIASVLGDVAEKFGLNPSYEYRFITGGRADALYGQVIIEYEAPDSLRSERKLGDSVKQLKEYITKLAKSEENIHKYLGVSIDGQNIAFVSYNDQDKHWFVRGPFPISVETIRLFLEALRGLKRKPLDVNMMLLDFGPNSDNAKKAVQHLYRSPIVSNRSKVLFDDWRRVFKQVVAYCAEKTKGLESIYDIKGQVDYERLLFCIHTYYAFLMKIIAAEVVVLYGGGKFVRSYFSELLDAQLSGKLRDKLREIEEGTLFRKSLDLENFIEADYFSWYIDEWNEPLEDALGNVIKSLSDYEVATADLKPEKVRDLFKQLYQNLMPKNIRHDMGEYYTPDWLAELLLDEIGFTTSDFDKMNQKRKDEYLPLEQRLLDPACGSGTFLVLAIKRLKNYADQHYIDAGLLVRHILENIVGFDLNPLAVIAAKTNYLLALGDLLSSVGKKVEIPIYLADSIMIERKRVLAGDSYLLRTVVGEFSIPAKIVDNDVLANVLSVIERCVRHTCHAKEFQELIKREFASLSEEELFELTALYSLFTKLEHEKRNKIWTGIIRNSFAPLYAGRFDFVVGNPPWVNWESLPEGYKFAGKNEWKKYDLWISSYIGAIKSDISLLFTYACVDRYLKEDGLLGFLITQSAFKTESGSMFRKFYYTRDGQRTNLCLLKAHDIVDLHPFEGATNRTAAIILFRSDKKQTSYPLEYVLWKRKQKPISTNESIGNVKKNLTTVSNLIALPVNRNDRTSAWITFPDSLKKSINKILGSTNYEAHEGVNTGGANGVYWIKIDSISSKSSMKLTIPEDSRDVFTKLFSESGHREKNSVQVNINDIIIENMSDIGKKSIERKKLKTESLLIYPLIKGGDIKKWFIEQSAYILVPQFRTTQNNESWLKTNLPKTYDYLKTFQRILANRREYSRRLSSIYPFYTLFRLQNYTFAPYKVCWLRMGDQMHAALVSTANDKYVGNKPYVPQDTVAYICSYTENGVTRFITEDEGFYLTGILNSVLVNVILQSLASGTKSFASPQLITKNINIPKYDRNNTMHNRIVKLAKEARNLALNNSNKLCEKEQELDEIVGKLYNLNKQELDEIRNYLELVS